MAIDRRKLTVLITKQLLEILTDDRNKKSTSFYKSPTNKSLCFVLLYMLMNCMKIPGCIFYRVVVALRDYPYLQTQHRHQFCQRRMTICSHLPCHRPRILMSDLMDHRLRLCLQLLMIIGIKSIGILRIFLQLLLLLLMHPIRLLLLLLLIPGVYI